MPDKLKNMTVEALRWITSLMEDNKIPYLICGGFAAFAYGSKRAINDIDLIVSEENFDQVVNLGKAYISKPAKRYFEGTEGWHVKYVQFKFGEIKIEVGSSKDVEIFDTTQKKWVALQVDFSKIEYRSINEINLPLMAKEDLINYKKRLARPVDLYDIKAINKNI